MDHILYNEKQYVINSFKQYFYEYRDIPMAIYGLGKNTGEIINEFEDFNIIGLLDEVRIGEKLYGKEVISIESALKCKVGIIIIVAQDKNVPIIYHRIAEICENNNILVFDINGINQNVKKIDRSDLYEAYNEVKEDVLKAKILDAEVISFDIFDTLIMRNTLYPRDLLILLEKKIVEELGSQFTGFADKRILCEHRLYENCHPTLAMIYDLISKTYDFSKKECDKIMRIEIELEKKYILPRKAVISIYEYACKSRKKVYFTSDMYLPKDIMLEILCSIGIEIERDNLLISCEEGCAKYNGLFSRLIEKSNSNKIIHIGDNIEADINSAQRSGVKDTFWIPSSLKLLEESKAWELLSYDTVFENRCLIGRFIAVELNNPFLLEKTKGKLLLESEYELGRYFIAPLVFTFINWMIEKVNQDNIDKLLLGSRDGFIIKNIMDIFKAKNPKKISFDYSYFYASRSVCLLAGIRNDDDILYVAGLEFSGTDNELLKKRFFIKENELIEREVGENRDVYILRYRDLILRNANEIKKRYFRYIKKKEFSSYKKYGFFDFVSSGSCQMGLSQFTEWNIVGYYVNLFYDEHKKDLNINTFYPMTSAYKTWHTIIESYLFLENIFTSFETTLAGFTIDGEPQFSKENRDEKQLGSLKEIHRGIEDGCKEFLEMYPNLDIKDYRVADVFLGLLKEEYTIVNMQYFQDNPLVDEFCNRKFDVTV